jgi:uncharacterized membrane protein YedE/YeeE
LPPQKTAPTVPWILARYPVAGAALFGIGTVLAVVLTCNATGSLAHKGMEISALAGALGVIAYIGWLVGIASDLTEESSTPDKSEPVTWALTEQSLSRLVAEAYAEGRRSAVKTEKPSTSR